MPADRKAPARRPRLDRLVLGAVLVLPALYVAGRRPAAPAPGDALPALLARLEARGLRLHAVPADNRNGDVRRGVYLCDRRREWEQVAGLPVGTRRAERWRGVVLAQTSSDFLTIPDEAVRSWGASGHRDGPFVFFGDPALLARLKAALAP
jgi:hypothetical protein